MMQSMIQIYGLKKVMVFVWQEPSPKVLLLHHSNYYYYYLFFCKIAYLFNSLDFILFNFC